MQARDGAQRHHRSVLQRQMFRVFRPSFRSYGVQITRRGHHHTKMCAQAVPFHSSLQRRCYVLAKQTFWSPRARVSSTCQMPPGLSTLSQHPPHVQHPSDRSVGRAISSRVCAQAVPAAYCVARQGLLFRPSRQTVWAAATGLGSHVQMLSGLSSGRQNS